MDKWEKSGSFKRLRVALPFLLAAAGVLLATTLTFADEDQTLAWRNTLQEADHSMQGLQAADVAKIQTVSKDLETLRSSIAQWLQTHPEVRLGTKERLSTAMADTTLDGLKQSYVLLDSAIAQISAQVVSSPFHLGRLELAVTDTAPALPAAPVTATLDRSEIDEHAITRVSQAFDYLPGVDIQHISARNEAGIMVRGFSTRGQVPFYLDGIPVSVPYDGYVDFNRFLSSDLAEVQVDKGYSSPLQGPNALGGTINLVTHEPAKKLEGDALIGTGSGNTLLSALRLGSRWKHFFFQGSMDWLQNDYIPLSNNFPVYQYTKLPHIEMTDRLNHSDSRDEKYSGRIGWTPKGEDEYVFSYINQKGNKGVPLYQGANKAATFNKFWSWPYWNMDSYYFHSNTRLGENSSVSFHAFYNQFRNSIDMFSDDTYTVMNTKSAEHSFYDEHTDGGTTQFTTRLLRHNVINASFFFKDDTHKESGVYPALGLTLPTLLDRDQQTSIGLQDALTISSRFRATIGFSADHFDGMQAQSYNTTNTKLIPFTCLASPKNTSFSGCTAHAWNYNPQASLSYTVFHTGNLFVTFSDRGRFPMLKDIYSASMGAGLPNPDLLPEHSRNWNAGYSQSLPANTLVQVQWFRSDLRNAIESVYVTDPGGSSKATAYCPNSKITGYCSQNANIGKEAHQGAEINIRSTPISRLSLQASYSYLNRTIDYNFANFSNVSQVNTSINVLPTLPKNKLVTSASVRLPHKALAIVSARFEGGLVLQDTTYATTSPLFAPYAEYFGTMDLGGAFPITKGISMEAGAKNLFDRNYYFTAGYPEIGRNWYLNLRYRF